MNHRSGKMRRDHWWSSGPTLPFKQGPPEHIPQDCVHTAYEYLQGERLLLCLGSLSSAQCCACSGPAHTGWLLGQGLCLGAGCWAQGAAPSHGYRFPFNSLPSANTADANSSLKLCRNLVSVKCLFLSRIQAKAGTWEQAEDWQHNLSHIS